MGGYLDRIMKTTFSYHSGFLREKIEVKNHFRNTVQIQIT